MPPLRSLISWAAYHGGSGGIVSRSCEATTRRVSSFYPFARHELKLTISYPIDAMRRKTQDATRRLNRAPFIPRGFAREIPVVHLSGISRFASEKNLSRILFIIFLYCNSLALVILKEYFR